MDKRDDENLEQGFNDAELADIMNEIEGLEKDIEPATPVEAKVSDVGEANEVLSELVETPVEKVVPLARAAKAKVSSSATSAMDISISGNMVVNLNFNVSGQSVSLSLDESQGLVIEMGNGGKFVLPLGNAAGTKAA